ncbi:MAG: IMP dehydrogenase [Bdellovibrionales bacterium]|nr:IMP dehydrogenase [Bdellovibrionales bacterium]
MMHFEDTALTYDDLLLVPQFSEVVPSEVQTRSFFARNVYLNTPVISAAMDTVTEHKMARVLAQLGGLGFIHKNMTIEEQAFEVEKVKKYESGMITDPIVLAPDLPVSRALEVMQKYGISGVPIVVNKKLVGILTNRDLRFEKNLSQPISNLMTKEGLVTAPQGITLQEAKTILQKHRIEKLPVTSPNGDLAGLITIKDIEKSSAFPQATKDSKGRLLVGAAVGIDATSRDRIAALAAQGVDVIAVDTAHGHSKNVLTMVDWVASNYPDIILVAGNVVTPEATEELFKRKTDVVKVGVGPGSICTTRVVAGVGMPQASAVRDCALVAKKMKKTIIADGGIKYSGDVAKALALGANSVMIGNLLAGADESPGEMVIYQGRTYKTYRGMGSLGAMKKGSRDRYFQADVEDGDKLVPEGIEGRVPYRGSTSGIVHQLVGGVRSGMGYVGAASIEALQERAKFVRISTQAYKESHVHDVAITKEAPNYRLE